MANAEGASASHHRVRRLSKDLKGRGFSFVGSTIIYAHMQAVGMVNDHAVGCFRRRNVSQYGRVGTVLKAQGARSERLGP